MNKTKKTIVSMKAGFYLLRILLFSFGKRIHIYKCPYCNLVVKPDIRKCPRCDGRMAIVDKCKLITCHKKATDELKIKGHGNVRFCKQHYIFLRRILQ